MPDDTAASDLIGVMILIGVFVTAAAIVGVTLLSSPPGDAAPAMLAHMEREDETLSLYHDGGDPLERGYFAVLVDGVDRTADFDLVDASRNPSSDWTSWKTGQALVLSDLPESESPHLQIIAREAGGSWLLHDLGGGTAVRPTVTPTPGPTPVPPAADFTANVTSGPAPLGVAFTDASTGGPTSWHWDFGDGGSSTEQNPVHTYIIPGTYTVTLTAENAHGTDTATKSGYITVASPIVADFTANVTSGEAPLAVQFTDRSSGTPSSWSWDFGDGGTSTEQHATHTYTAEGTYNVTLTVNNAYGSDTVTKSGYIRVTKMHVSRLEVNAVTRYLEIPVAITINHTGDPDTGSDTTPFVLTRTDANNSNFNATLTAPTGVTLLEFFDWKILTLEFEEWQVGETEYLSPTIEVSVPDAESRTATAYYVVRVFP